MIVTDESGNWGKLGGCFYEKKGVFVCAVRFVIGHFKTESA